MLAEVPFGQPEVFSQVQADPVTPAQDSTSPSEIASLLASWRLSLAARRSSPATIATYSSAVLLLRDYLAAQGMPTGVERIRREHVEAFLTDLLGRRAPATAHNRFRGCQAFFNWLLEEGEIGTSPMVRMKPGLYSVLGPEEAPDVKPDSLQALVQRYAPVYVIYPEGQPGDPAPFPLGQSDYHPRRVELYLEDAVLTEPLGRRFAQVAVILAGVLFVILQWFLFHGADALVVYGLYAAYFAALGAAIVFSRRKRAYAGVEKMRDRLTTALPGGLPFSNLTYQGFRLAPSSDDVWTRYVEKIRASETSDKPEKYRRTVYAHVVENSGNGRFQSSLVIEYWSFYYYNHWNDLHEADWESVALYFDRGRRKPKAAAYSNHLGCLWRAWPDVKKWSDGTRPLVFVAIGSHANFFEPRPEGFAPVFASRVPVTWPGFVPWFLRVSRLGGQLAAQTGKDRDHVPCPSLPLVDQDFHARYEIATTPHDVSLEVDPFIPEGHAIWQQWWWLRFQGGWALHTSAQAIQGPAAQDERWQMPYTWAFDGQADANWDQFFKTD